MTLQEATENVTAALRDQDLTALAAALAGRAAAIQAGARPTPEIREAGERALDGLLALKQRLAFRSARLEQLRTSLALPPTRRHFDYRG